MVDLSNWMKGVKVFLSNLFESCGSFILSVLDFTYNVLITAISYIHLFSKKAVGLIFYKLIQLINKEKIAAMEQKVELYSQQQEITLLMKAIEVRDDGAEQGWSPGHTMAINEICQALVLDCNWEEKHAHDYMKRVVEKVNGLTYRISDEEH
jgi:hypothetical protein